LLPLTAPVLSIIVLAGLCGLLVGRIDLRAMLDILAAIHPVWATLAIGSIWLAFLGGALRYHAILAHQADTAPALARIFNLICFTHLTAYATPFSALSDVARAGYARLRLEVDTRAAIESVIYDRVLALLGMAGIGLLCLLPQLALGVSVAVIAGQAALWLAGIGAVGGLLLLSERLVTSSRPSLAALGRSMRNFFRLFDTAGAALRQLVYNFVGILGIGLTMAFLARGMGLGANMVLVFSFAPLVLFVQNLPVVYAGWGARETVVVLVLGPAGGIEPSSALALSVATGAALFLGAIPFSLLFGVTVLKHR
jgi:Lysylphosphatidylglycerol synthase TM region